MTDIDKSWYEANQGATNEWRIATFQQINSLIGTHSASWGTNAGPDMWFPHNKGKMANVLLMDGHVAQIYANDLVMPGFGTINTTTTPWIYNATAGNGASGLSNGAPPKPAIKGWMVGYYKASATPQWQIPWNKYAPSF